MFLLQGPMCMPTFSDKDGEPCLQLKGVWHPLIACKVIVPSDIELGGGRQSSALITGTKNIQLMYFY